jgi:hypothetical protein
MTEPTCHVLAVAALAEINPRVAATIDAIGTNATGHPLPGLAGWLPFQDRLDLARALMVVHAQPRGCGWENDTDAETLARDIWLTGAWRWPRSGEDQRRMHAGMLAYLRA